MTSKAIGRSPPSTKATGSQEAGPPRAHIQSSTNTQVRTSQPASHTGHWSRASRQSPEPAVCLLALPATSATAAIPIPAPTSHLQTDGPRTHRMNFWQRLNKRMYKSPQHDTWHTVRIIYASACVPTVTVFTYMWYYLISESEGHRLFFLRIFIYESRQVRTV